MTEPAGGDHYLNLPDAMLVPTRATRTTARLLKTAIRAKAMLCIHGAVGLGKTVAVTTNLRDLAPDNTVRLDLREGATLSTLRTLLHRELGLPGQPPTTALAIDDALIEALADHHRVLVCDEAQGLSAKALDYLRRLWDHRHVQLTVVLVGGENCYQRIRSRDALASRICAWQQYSPLTPDEVLAAIPTYHPLWADVSPQDLLWVDDNICHGNFRNWAKATFHLREALQDDEDIQGFTRDLMRAVIMDLDSTIRAQLPNAGYL